MTPAVVHASDGRVDLLYPDRRCAHSSRRGLTFQRTGFSDIMVTFAIQETPCVSQIVTHWPESSSIADFAVSKRVSGRGSGTERKTSQYANHELD